MKRIHEDYLRDMLENAEKALSFVNGISYEDFETDDKAVYAVRGFTGNYSSVAKDAYEIVKKHKYIVN